MGSVPSRTQFRPILNFHSIVELATGYFKNTFNGHLTVKFMVHLPDFRYYTEWHCHANQKHYDAPADPWSHICVDPADPERFAVVSLLWGLGRVRGGNWDCPENCHSLTDNQMYEGLRQHFEEGRDWEKTVYHDWVAESIEDEGHFRGYEDLETAIKEHYPAVDELYECIREEGYRANHGNVYDNPEEIEGVHELDPMVLVGRAGEVIWTEGFHRLYLARFLGIDEIPVYVLRRNVEWQLVRERIAAVPDGKVPVGLSEYANHPDLRDLVR